MSIILEELAKLMYDNYETAALNRGWYPNTHKSLSWAFMPEENKKAWRDAAVVIESIIREDERAKYDTTETIQSDLQEITKVLGINRNTRAQSYSSHELIQNEILPKIRSMKGTLVALRDTFSRNFVEVKAIIDEGRNL
jgi:hypothetical protein